jgi:hypothetical protein
MDHYRGGVDSLVDGRYRRRPFQRLGGMVTSLKLPHFTLLAQQISSALFAMNYEFMLGAKDEPLNAGLR